MLVKLYTGEEYECGYLQLQKDGRVILWDEEECGSKATHMLHRADVEYIKDTPPDDVEYWGKESPPHEPTRACLFDPPLSPKDQIREDYAALPIIPSPECVSSGHTCKWSPYVDGGQTCVICKASLSHPLLQHAISTTAWNKLR